MNSRELHLQILRVTTLYLWALNMVWNDWNSETVVWEAETGDLKRPEEDLRRSGQGREVLRGQGVVAQVVCPLRENVVLLLGGSRQELDLPLQLQILSVYWPSRLEERWWLHPVNQDKYSGSRVIQTDIMEVGRVVLAVALVV